MIYKAGYLKHYVELLNCTCSCRKWLVQHNKPPPFIIHAMLHLNLKYEKYITYQEFLIRFLCTITPWLLYEHRNPWQSFSMYIRLPRSQFMSHSPYEINELCILIFVKFWLWHQILIPSLGTRQVNIRSVLVFTFMMWFVSHKSSKVFLNVIRYILYIFFWYI